MQKKIPESELILNPDASVYHLKLRPTDIADRIIFVGDPDRVEQVGKHFDTIDTRIQKREFHTLSGYIGPQRLTVISTGIGTDNIDIVWNELDALVNIDLDTRQIRTDLKQLKVLRLGTCGGLDPQTPVGAMVSTQYAIGSDGLMHYYDPETYTPKAFQSSLNTFQLQNLNSIPSFYSASASLGLTQLISEKYPAILPGITFTAAGFYAPQGRNLGRVALATPDLTKLLQNFQYEDFPIRNIEMETAGILALGKALGHEAGSLSVILANRSKGEFHPAPQAAIEKLIQQGLEIMLNWDKA